MSFASRFNKTQFDVDVKDFSYAKLSDLYNSTGDKGKKVHTINGMWVHKSQLGDSPVFIVADEKLLVNIPSFASDTVREILADDTAVQAIKDGKVGFTIYEYDSHGKKCYNVRFVDL